MLELAAMILPVASTRLVLLPASSTLSPFIDYRLEQCVPLEEFSAGPGLARRYALRTQEWIDPREVITRALAGDPHARHVIESGGRAVGSAIAQLVNTLDPERVSIGGNLILPYVEGLPCGGGRGAIRGARLALGVDPRAARRPRRTRINCLHGSTSRS